MPVRGFMKGELENITDLKIIGQKGYGEWIQIDKLNQVTEKKYVIEYKTKDGKRIAPEVDQTIIEKDVDIGQDINIYPDEFAKTLGEEPFSPDTISYMISERAKNGRRLFVNVEVINYPFGRFRYTKVRFTSNREINYEEQFKKAVNAVNILIIKYRSITNDFWITKIREEDIFLYKSVRDNSFDLSYTSKGIIQIRPDHSTSLIDHLYESLISDQPEFPSSIYF